MAKNKEETLKELEELFLIHHNAWKFANDMKDYPLASVYANKECVVVSCIAIFNNTREDKEFARLYKKYNL